MTMNIRKALITSAGLGTRMRPVTSKVPKAMLPIFDKGDGKIRVIPVVDKIMDNLRETGVRKFCFVVDSKKKLLREYLLESGKDAVFVYQRKAKGFGDAVMRGASFVGNEPFFLCTDDNLMTGGYREGARAFRKLKMDCLLFLKKTDSPERYGIASGKETLAFEGHMLMKITDVEEKPSSPKSDLAIIGVYIFSPKIFAELRKIGDEMKDGKEKQLTPGIQNLVKGNNVYGMILEEEEWLDVGNPEDYFQSLNYSYNSI